MLKYICHYNVFYVITHNIVEWSAISLKQIKSSSFRQIEAKYNNLLFKDQIITAILNEFQLYRA